MANISFRSDAETDRALAVLTAEGSDKSEAIRQALINEARRHRRERMRTQSEALAKDPADVAEMRTIMAEMDAVRAW